MPTAENQILLETGIQNIFNYEAEKLQIHKL